MSYTEGETTTTQLVPEPRASFTRRGCTSAARSLRRIAEAHQELCGHGGCTAQELPSGAGTLRCADGSRDQAWRWNGGQCAARSEATLGPPPALNGYEEAHADVFEPSSTLQPQAGFTARCGSKICYGGLERRVLLAKLASSNARQGVAWPRPYCLGIYVSLWAPSECDIAHQQEGASIL